MRLIHALYRSQPGGDRYVARFQSDITVTMPAKMVGRYPRSAAQLALEISRGDVRHSVVVRRGR